MAISEKRVGKTLNFTCVVVGAICIGIGFSSWWVGIGIFVFGFGFLPID